MSTFDDLPVLLVSAATEPVATSVILDLIDIDVTADYNEDIKSPDRVWRLLNKYYSADVRVHALTDGEILALDPHSVKAHIIHITEEEAGAGGAGRAAARAAASAGAWARCHVRVLLADCAAEPTALGAWALAQRAELVARREAARAQPAGEPFAELFGVQRARAALHAHAWAAPPERAGEDAPNRIRVARETISGSSSDSELEWRGEDEDEVRAVEQAEAFAAALGALGSAPPPPPGDALPLRLQRAEELVLAFCRALGLDPDSA